MAERVCAGFGDIEDNSSFPIVCLRVKPLNEKFADELTHRDYLGAIMNLGIKRELVGDIITDGKCGYVFCLKKAADYLCENLVRIRRTSVKTELSPVPDIPHKEPQITSVFAASLRLDVVAGAVYNLSRSETAKLIKGERVFINSVLTTNISHTLAGGDIVSVRGYGRFAFVEQVKTTKKGRLVINIKKY